MRNLKANPAGDDGGSNAWANLPLFHPSLASLLFFPMNETNQELLECCKILGRHLVDLDALAAGHYRPYEGSQHQKDVKAALDKARVAIRTVTAVKNRDISLIPERLCTDRFLAAWAAWADERAKRKQPLTRRAMELQLGKLGEMGESDAVEAIYQSIQNGWIGIFPPRNNGFQKPRREREKHSAVW